MSIVNLQMNYNLLKQSFANKDLSLPQRLQILHLLSSSARGVSLEDLLLLLPRSVSNTLMHLRKNSSCFNEFIETFYTADEFSSPIPILSRESVFSESLKKSIQILNSKALIESSYKIQHIAIEKMNKKQNFD